MKFYETSFEDYLNSAKRFNIHPELDSIYSQFPPDIQDFKNIILYGPPGSGKYTQALKIIERYSPSRLKYDKKISVTNEKLEKKQKTVVFTEKTCPKKKEKSVTIANKKQEFVYRISDIHYEIDMSLLGCNSKNLWHEIFFQIIDIISVKQHKVGIILCKNFHTIYNELLDIFYSYMKHPLEHYNIQCFFILITEQMGFLPNNILHSSLLLSVVRPTKCAYLTAMDHQQKKLFFHTSGECVEVMANIDNASVVNMKELFGLKTLKSLDDIPHDLMYVIADGIIETMKNGKKLQLHDLRNQLYDMLVYNVDIPESIGYIIFYFIRNAYLPKDKVTELLRYTYVFFQYYNNNYRSIYHLENLIVFTYNRLHFS